MDTKIADASAGASAPAPGPTVANQLWRAAAVVSVGACAFHGYRRNQSIGWGAGWGILGGLFPVITVAIAAAQGFGKRAGK